MSVSVTLVSIVVFALADDDGQYSACLKYEREFAHPLHKILYSDITGDGLSELVVLSTAGLHLLQVPTPVYPLYIKCM